jgi:ABC-type nickel/cobalt efflux system permease component RcnA
MQWDQIVIGAVINLWDPVHVTGLAVFITALVLGVIHGITPDEHTWPITFSYAIGSYSTNAYPLHSARSINATTPSGQRALLPLVVVAYGLKGISISSQESLWTLGVVAYGLKGMGIRCQARNRY